MTDAPRSAVADAVRSAEVPILPMVVERILAPNPADDEDRRAILDWHHPELERLIEVHSSWGSSP